MIKRQMRRGTDGFTLIEMLICALIFGIMLAGYSSLFTYALKSWTSTIGRMDRTEALSAGVDKLGADFRSIIPPYTQMPGLGLIGYDQSAPRPLTASVQDEVLMHTATWCDEEGYNSGFSTGSDPKADMQRVCYWMREDPADIEGRLQYDYLVSSREDYPYQLNAAAGGNQKPTIVRVSQFNVEYFNGTSWLSTWNSTTSNTLPELIRITITTKSGNDTSTIVTIHRPMARETKVTQ